MERTRFQELVVKAVDSLPDEFRDRLENVDVVVDDLPSPGQLTSTGLGRGQTLLGLYQGVPQTRRSRHYGMVTPDKITIFQKPIEARCRSDDEVASVIYRVVRHEIAHHFGIGDKRLRELERGQHPAP